jgi:hypothetical protein
LLLSTSLHGMLRFCLQNNDVTPLQALRHLVAPCLTHVFFLISADFKTRERPLPATEGAAPHSSVSE